MSTGNIAEIIGAGVDAEFPRGAVPRVYAALNVGETGLTLEVQQQLGDGVVRSIAMGSSDGLKRGLAVSSTGAPITVPVGEATLGRILDVLGNPVDEAGPVGAEHQLPIHRKPPSYADQSPTVDLLDVACQTAGFHLRCCNLGHTTLEPMDVDCLTVAQEPLLLQLCLQCCILGLQLPLSPSELCDGKDNHPFRRKSLWRPGSICPGQSLSLIHI